MSSAQSLSKEHLLVDGPLMLCCSIFKYLQPCTRTQTTLSASHGCYCTTTSAILLTGNVPQWAKVCKETKYCRCYTRIAQESCEGCLFSEQR